MATKTTDFLTSLQIRLKKTLSTSSTPTLAQVYEIVYNFSDKLLALCSQFNSELGRKTASISLVDGTSLYRDVVDDFFAPVTMFVEGVPYSGWLEKTYDRVGLQITNEFDSLNFGVGSTNENEPNKFYLDQNGNLVLLNTPDASYTFKFPYYYHQTRIAASTLSVAGASKASPCVITCTAHGLFTGNRIYIDSVVGMTQLNGYWFTVTRVTADTFSLDGVDSSAYTTWASAGTIYTSIPFNGAFDHLFIEYCAYRFQAIEEYNQTTEEAILAILFEDARRIILSRKGTSSKVIR